MGKGIDWKSPEAFTRLLAAVVAAQDLKLDYRKIASMYGQGATYDSIEGRFRIIKREAAALRAEIEQGDRPEAPPRGAAAAKSAPAASTAASSFASSAGLPSEKPSTPRKPRTPKKTGVKSEDGGRVLTGRVNKNTSSSAKAANAAIVKAEPPTSEDSFFANQRDIDTGTDLISETFMEAIAKADFEDVLQYDAGMGI